MREKARTEPVAAKTEKGKIKKTPKRIARGVCFRIISREDYGY